MNRIIRNCIRCKHCGDVIESKSRHDYRTCKCGRVAVDGGHDYLRRSFPAAKEPGTRSDPDDYYDDLSIILREEEENGRI